MTGSVRGCHWRIVSAIFFSAGAARVKPASRRHVARTRRLAGNGLHGTTVAGITGLALDQAGRVGMAGMKDDLAFRSALTDSAAIHDGNIIADAEKKTYRNN